MRGVAEVYALTWCEGDADVMLLGERIQDAAAQIRISKPAGKGARGMQAT